MGEPLKIKSMHKIEQIFSEKKVSYYFDADLSMLSQLAPQEKIIIITDENIYHQHVEKFSGYPIIKFPGGEQNKNQQTVDRIIEELIGMEANKDAFLIGVGGGVVTDVTGYVAAVYLRGVKFALVRSVARTG